jgi:para-aminobenzoate synthetase component I
VHIEALTIEPRAEHLAQRLIGRPGLVWLSGSQGHGDEGRWSFLGSDPDSFVQRPWDDPTPWRALAGQLEVAQVHAGPPSERLDGAPPWERIPHWIGYVAYEGIGPGGWAAGSRAQEPACLPHPALRLARYPALIALDHIKGRAFVVGDDRRACAPLAAAAMGACKAPPEAEVGAPHATSATRHREAIACAKAAIARGDIYQVNLARRWSASYRGDPVALWSRMLAHSPVPLGMYLDAGDHAVLACTMERFLRWDIGSRLLYTRPIKGTVARRGDRDVEEARWLVADPKERAEHTMIVDLMRNDLGRVAEIGSVQLADPMRVEPYAGLAHLVSTVRCTTRREITWTDVLEAAFPPGSVTGTPKRSAMGIIRALEPCPRGIYTGAVGYLDRSGGLSLAVAISTALIGAGQVQYHAGGGIVWDSDPAREVAETELKARVFLQALDDLAQ